MKFNTQNNLQQHWNIISKFAKINNEKQCCIIQIKINSKYSWRQASLKKTEKSDKNIRTTSPKIKRIQVDFPKNIALKVYIVSLDKVKCIWKCIFHKTVRYKCLSYTYFAYFAWTTHWNANCFSLSLIKKNKQSVSNM